MTQPMKANLPIRQLRDQLARLTAERDAARADANRLAEALRDIRAGGWTWDVVLVDDALAQHDAEVENR